MEKVHNISTIFYFLNFVLNFKFRMVNERWFDASVLLKNMFLLAHFKIEACFDVSSFFSIQELL